MKLTDRLGPKFNVKINVYDNGRLVDQRLSHNVVTNTGRTWLSRLVGASNYSSNPPLPHTTDKIGYIGLGCGGALQTDSAHPKSQTELVTVEALEDPVPYSLVGLVSTYLKQVDNQLVSSSVYFPGTYRTRFVVDVAETEVSYSGSEARVSGTVVNTSVPVSEAGLYLSSAEPTWDGGNSGADPAGANDLVCYNIFEPIIVTPNVILRLEWELRF
jgi:hypothetical protein